MSSFIDLLNAGKVLTPDGMLGVVYATLLAMVFFNMKYQHTLFNKLASSIDGLREAIGKVNTTLALTNQNTKNNIDATNRILELLINNKLGHDSYTKRNK